MFEESDLIKQFDNMNVDSYTGKGKLTLEDVLANAIVRKFFFVKIKY